LIYIILKLLKKRKMKKFIFVMVAMFAAIGASAQVATENQKLLDNVYVGVEAGVATPLNFKNIFPLNTVAGIKLGKELTPVVGLEVEGLVFFNDNHYQRWTKTFVKGTNVGLNGTINLMNLFKGYQGAPRFFEVKTNTGLGWMYFWNAKHHTLTAKTALDFNFNLGREKAHTLFVSPGVYWNLHNEGAIQFNKKYAQFAIFAGYVYHFKTSNGTRHFKTYDVGAMNAEINRLAAENGKLRNDLANKPVATAAVAQAVKTEPKAVKEVQYVEGTYIVNFAKNSYELDADAKKVLDSVGGTVDILGYASPDGSAEYNKELSQKRADAAAEYLKARGVKVNSAVGKGVVGKASNRIVIVHNVQD
jgi:outer membrane protein OmpA-like peptidoglycan-associated protein